MLRVEVDVHDLALAEPEVRSAAEHFSERRRDLRWIQQAARDLIEEWREEVVIALVDEQHVDGLTAQGLGALQAAEAAADHNDAGPRLHR